MFDGVECVYAHREVGKFPTLPEMDSVDRASLPKTTKSDLHPPLSTSKIHPQRPHQALSPIVRIHP